MPIMKPAQLLGRVFPASDSGPDSATPDEKWNGAILRVEAPFTNLAFSVANFYALFAIQLGASNAAIGWLTSGPALVALLWMFPAGQLIQRSKSYILALAGGALGYRLLVMALALVLLLPAPWRIPTLVTLVALGAFPSALWGLSFHSSAGEMFAPRNRARFVGQRWAVANVAGVVIMFGMGFLLDQLTFPRNFVTLFVGAPLLAMTTLVLVARLRMPARQPAAGRGARVSLRGIWEQARRYRSFVWFEMGALVGYTAFFFAAPLFRIYWVRDLGAAGSWLGGLTAAFSLGSVVGNLFWGRLSAPHLDRRLGLVAAAGLWIAYPLLTAAFSVLWPQALVMAVAGFFAGGNELLIFSRTVRQSPRAQRPTFIGVHNVTVNLAGFVAPLVSTALADAIGARAVLLLAGALGIAGAAAMYVLGWKDMPAEET